jgi:ketosteroid isomerase-like protein
MTTTTPDAATTVRRLLEAFLAGDAETFMFYVDDDIELNTAEHHPFLPHEYRGRQQFLDVVGKIAAELDGFRFDIERVLGCGEAAVSQLRYQGMVKSTGRSLDVQAVFVWDVRGGKVIRMQEYCDTWAFMDAWKAGELANRHLYLTSRR